MTHIATLRTGRAHPHPEPISGAAYSAVELMPVDRTVVLLDQRKLPRQEKYELLTRVEQIAEAITSMMVRGAPAIGITAAYGMVLAAGASDAGEDGFRQSMAGADALLRATRPTAVNLAWALDEMAAVVARVASRPAKERVATLAEAARAIHAADVAACRKMGTLGAANVKDGATILTHCNAGALATGGYGTALGVIRAAHALGKRVRVLADETRPLLQGARLTAWELHRDGIPVEIVTDSMAASLFAEGAIDQVVVGADRVARSGDVANKIGTYGVACLAHLHGVPFDVAAPFSTVDLACPSGKEIPIERRKEQEVTHLLVGDQEVPLAPDGVRARNPAFDVTPARLIRALYTERGTVNPVNEAGVVALGAKR